MMNKFHEDQDIVTENESVPPETDHPNNLSGGNLLFMSVASFFFYLLIALGLYYWFFEEGISSAFDHGYSFTRQVAAGGLAGCLAAAVIIFLSGRRPLSNVLDDFFIYRVIVRTRFTAIDRVQLSLFAGVGEELLFRGAMQPLLGIWVTSILFVAIHGYFKFKSAGHILFGALMFGLSVLLGFLFEYAGLVAAMSAHAVYDLVMLWWVKEKQNGAGPGLDNSDDRNISTSTT